MKQPIRIGYGYDVHRLEEGLTLTIGGVVIEHTKGVVAHSDGDVLLHAICDALLGALALGDIGTHFPDTSNDFKGIDSTILLKKCCDMVCEHGYMVGNIDSMLNLERPKIKKFSPLMRERIAEVIGISIDDISIKATTKEGLGFVGNEEGVEASAVVLLYKTNE